MLLLLLAFVVHRLLIDEHELRIPTWRYPLTSFNQPRLTEFMCPWLAYLNLHQCNIIIRVYLKRHEFTTTTLLIFLLILVRTLIYSFRSFRAQIICKRISLALI